MSGVCGHCGTALAPSKTKPRKWCSDSCRRTAWALLHDRAACERCGEPMSPGNQRRGGTTCRRCRSEVLKIKQRARFEDIARLWSDGASLREIAQMTGSTVNSVTTAMATMRREGWVVPHRYRVKNGRRVGA